MLPIVRPRDRDRAEHIARLLERASHTSPEVEAGARAILADVRARGDAAVREATARFEKRHLEHLELDSAAWQSIADRTSAEMRQILARAHERIRRFHAAEAERLLASGYTLSERAGDGSESFLQLAVRPLARVGLYAPGGTALYPSTVLMTAVPAKVAGVGELVLVTPGPSPECLYAARLAGVDRVFAIGGAQAIGALAYGTESVPRVDKIVGPGNAWVAAAKRLVFGDVDIDQVAGPSEVLVVADEHTDPERAAADLLAQAEHDVDAYAVLATTSLALAEAVAAAVEKQLADLPRRAIAGESITRHGAAVVFENTDELVAFVNRFAPEHLELLDAGARWQEAAARYPNAGAIFVGDSTPEAVGDYYAGPNHVLPTGGSARFSSPLGVHDFIKRTSVLSYSRALLAEHAGDIVRFAEAEGLHAHGRQISVRTARCGRAGDGESK